ncbi:uncharacterized protein LOC115628787 isoform X1 [Scaptodrosophila lebanonensis]|uniref:Uncharacterized protein LOC115628787 isoform X1 n=1 Tax=Drosophila lebanonensis TaxID=7225 RepID=A0A6J2U159_DROLE|nr:uncharacterized protein LOC115628787 isoform X1 [Scaptodrosophila lebanonensis]
MYNLDENNVRALIANRLKGKDVKWLQSRNDLLTIPINELLNEMETVFQNRESLLSLKRKFEKKTWQLNESFQEYFYEKLILSTKLNVDKIELLEHIIDGIPNYNLRTQARMQRFKNTTELLDAFKSIQLKPDYTHKMDNKQNIEPSANANSRQMVVKCFNCNSKGHMAPECRKPKRTPGACFVCNEMGHISINCSKRNDLELRENMKANNQYKH